MLSGSSDEEEDFDVLGFSSWLVKSYTPSMLEPFRLSKARSWCFDIRGRVLIKFWQLCAPHFRRCDGNPTVGTSLAFIGEKTRTIILIGGINTHLN